ncbi:MAG: hypothetical protein WB699_10215 [Bacteroidota bacterium]
MDHHSSRSIGSILSFLTHSAYFSAKAFAVNRVKYGREYRARGIELEQSERMNADELHALQEKKLRRLIEHAVANVPYYQHLFESLHLTPADIRTVKDLKKIPILTKEVLRAQSEMFIARNIPKAALASGWTTGSTGMPINALRDRRSIVFESSSIWRQRSVAGVTPRDRKVAVWGTIWNDTIVSSSQDRPPYWRYNAADRQLLFSYYHMSEETLQLYVDRLKTFRPTFIEGFPSTILVLAEFMKKRGIVIPLRAVFTSSERLYDVHRAVIEESFQAKVFDLYGQSERVVLATECEAHAGLHVNPEYGVLELLHKGEDVAPGESGEIIGTGLNNFAMPLIRYRTGDVATLAESGCACGRASTLLKYVEGRSADLIVTPEGRIIPGNGVMIALHGIENVARTQIVQDAVDHLTIRVIKENREAGIDDRTIVQNLRTCVGDRVRIDVETVDAIDNHGQPKLRWVVSTIHNGY